MTSKDNEQKEHGEDSNNPQNSFVAKKIVAKKNALLNKYVNMKNYEKLGFWRAASFSFLIILALSWLTEKNNYNSTLNNDNNAGQYVNEWENIDDKNPFLRLFFDQEINDKLNEIKNQHIAFVKIETEIFIIDEIIDTLKLVTEDKNAKAAIIYMNSPGGTASGSEKLYHAIKKLNKQKPVYIYTSDINASGGYLASMGGEKLFSSSTAIIGSIGVIIQWGDFSNLLNSIGVKIEKETTSIYKAQPDFFSPTQKEVRKSIQAIIKDTQKTFVSIIKKSRPQAKLSAMNGEIFSSSKAKSLGLIDGIKTLEEVTQIIIKDKNLDENLKLVERQTLDFKTVLQKVGAVSTTAGIILPIMKLSSLSNQLNSNLANIRKYQGLMMISPLWIAPKYQ